MLGHLRDHSPTKEPLHMKRLILIAAALSALVAASAAVAHLKTGDVTQVSATLSAATAANVQTRTVTCDGQTIEITHGRYSGTATSTTTELNGTVDLFVKSTYNTTKKLGWVDGWLKVRGSDKRTRASFTAINVDGKLDGWLRGSAESPRWRAVRQPGGLVLEDRRPDRRHARNRHRRECGCDRQARQLQRRQADAPERVPVRSRRCGLGQRDRDHGEAEATAPRTRPARSRTRTR